MCIVLYRAMYAAVYPFSKLVLRASKATATLRDSSKCQTHQQNELVQCVLLPDDQIHYTGNIDGGPLFCFSFFVIVLLLLSTVNFIDKPNA